MAFVVTEWTGLGDGTSWNDPANWSNGVPDSPPGSTDIVSASIDIPGAYVFKDLDVIDPPPATTDSLFVGSETTLELWGSLTANDTVFTLNSTILNKGLIDTPELNIQLDTFLVFSDGGEVSFETMITNNASTVQVIGETAAMHYDFVENGEARQPGFESIDSHATIYGDTFSHLTPQGELTGNHYFLVQDNPDITIFSLLSCGCGGAGASITIDDTVRMKTLSSEIRMEGQNTHFYTGVTAAYPDGVDIDNTLETITEFGILSLTDRDLASTRALTVEGQLNTTDSFLYMPFGLTIADTGTWTADQGFVIGDTVIDGTANLDSVIFSGDVGGTGDIFASSFLFFSDAVGSGVSVHMGSGMLLGIDDPDHFDATIVDFLPGDQFTPGGVIDLSMLPGGSAVEYDGANLLLRNGEGDIIATLAVQSALTDYSGVSYVVTGNGMGGTEIEIASRAVFGSVYIAGNNNSETITGDTVADTIVAYGGSDHIDAGGGNDTVMGGTGNDVVVGSAGDGDDNLNGGTGFDTYDLSSTSANAIIDLSAQTATSADIGTDTLVAIERILSGSGDDLLTGRVVNDELHGNGGADTILGNAGYDYLYGGSGDDSIRGGNDYDTLDGGSGNDTLMGDANNDWLSGGEGDDILNGGANLDFADYSKAASAVTVRLSTIQQQDTGGAGLDTLLNFEGVQGSDFNDSLVGNTQDNLLFGGAGSDTIKGGAGFDALWGGAGRDVMYGGADPDTFAYSDITESAPGATNRDTIADFSGFVANGGVAYDQIDLFGLEQSVGRFFTFHDDGLFHGGFGDIRDYVTAGGNTFLEIDLDGDKHADFQIAITGVHDIVQEDLYF